MTDRTNSVLQFDNFYRENYERCRMTKSYPINKTRMDDWVASMISASESYGLDYVGDFACAIRDYTKHVSFTDFELRIKTVTTELREQINSIRASVPNLRVILVVPHLVHKSNLWVAVLAYKYISDLCTDVVYTTEDALGLYSQSQTPTLALICDDASYSGTQIADTVVSTGSREYQTIILCPYISRRAVSKISKSGLYVNILESTYVFDNFADRYIREYGSDSMARILADPTMTSIFYYPLYLDRADDICAIYFDHKLADGISTFQKIYALGVVYTQNELPPSRSLISGCESSYSEIDPNSIISSQILDIQYTAGADNMCPVAFYKTIRYTIGEGEIPSSGMVRDIFNLRDILSDRYFKSVQSLIESVPSAYDVVQLLFDAVGSDNPQIVQLLLQNHADPTANDNYAIGYSMESGFSGNVGVLLRDGRADPTIDGNRGIIISVENNYTDVLRELLRDHRADPTVNKSSIIVTAVKNNNVEAVRLLVMDNRVDAIAYNNSALMLGLRERYIPIVRVLLSSAVVRSRVAATVGLQRYIHETTGIDLDS